MALDYDWWINPGDAGLGFNTVVSKDRPYERATASFRKDQLDATPTVGDQSLTGWWTRGQLSFHKGAGTKFYEIEGAPGLIDTFASGAGVDVTTPGWVRPYEAVQTVEETTAFACFDGAPYGRSEVLTGITPAGAIKTLQLTFSGGHYSLTPVAITSTGTPAWCARGVGYFGGLWFATSHGIERLPTGAGTSLTSIWTMGLGALAPKKIFYAKDRLFVVNEAGDWWAVAGDATGTLDLVDCFWRSGKAANGYTYDPSSFIGNWSMTDSPGPAYAAYENRVYAFALDETGLLPALEAGITVCELPDGERIFDIKYVAGHVVIASSAGVRVADVGDDGSLSVGPVFPEMVEANSIAAWGDKAVVTAQGGETAIATALVIDLTQRVSTGLEGPRFAYHLFFWTGAADERLLVQHIWGVGPVFTGSVWATFRIPQPSAYDALDLFDDPVDFQLGQVTTGLHRFGTLDKKWYASVDVRFDISPGSDEIVGDAIAAPPAGGTVSVTAVLADGTTMALGDVAANVSASELPIGVLSEALALQFDLTHDDEGNIPYLAGYQLKALPVPKRQRMIRVPLMLVDNETNRTGQKMVFDPWERLSALEALEESNAVVTFEDKQTGESGTAYIEAVEVQRTAASDFGGIVFVTLRKLLT